MLRLCTDSKQKVGELRRSYEFGDLIWVDPTVDCRTEDFARIYAHVHCTVHPSKGEGYDMVPFQSVACETPVIASHATGSADYLDETNSIRLRTSGRVEGERVGNAAGTHFSTDEDHLVHCLRHAVDNWEEEYAKVQCTGEAFRERDRCDFVLKDSISLVGELLSAREGPDRQKLALTRSTTTTDP